MKIQLDQKAFTAWFESMDKEAQIELSLNIMNKFAESYLKPLIHNQMIKDMLCLIDLNRSLKTYFLIL